MKKSTVAIMCASALCLTLLAGCAKTEPGEESKTPDTSPAVSDDANEPAGDPAEAPVKTGESKKLDVSVEGETESIDVNEYEAVVNGKTISFYLDDANYNAYYFEGELEIAPMTEAGVEPVAKLHMSYTAGKTADIAAKDGLDQLAGATDAGMTKIGDYDAYQLNCGAAEESFTVYYIALGEDTLAISAYSIGDAAEGVLVRLLAMAATVAAE